MSASGAGRHVTDALVDRSSEALPDPVEEADFALQQIPWIFPSDRRKILEVIDQAGLQFCWKVPGA